MLRGKITIRDNGAVHVPDNVLMKDFEIAQLLGVYTQTIKVNIKTILKLGVCHGDYSHGGTVVGNSVVPDYFGLEMVITLVFRVQSPKADIFRRWVIRQLTASNINQKQPIFIKLTNGQLSE